MLKITSKGGQTLSLESANGSLLVFPEKPSSDSNVRSLLSVPEEEQVSGTVSWPGEYDYGGISIRGFGRNGHVSYIVTTEGLRCGFFSSPLGQLEDHEIEALGDLDVLVVPAEDVKKVQQIVEEVDPPVVIPIKTKDSKVFQEVVAACGGKDVETVKEVKLKKSTLPTESREVYVLEG